MSRTMNGCISTRVVLAVSEALAVDPLDLPPLYEAIDPDALEALFTSRADRRAPTGHELQFSYAGHVVSIHDGEVTVDPMDHGRTKPT